MISANGTVAAESLPGLLSHHLAHLRASGLTDETIRSNAIRSMDDHHAIGQALNRKWSRKNGAALAFAYVDELGDVTFRRLRPDNPPNFNGKAAKYLQPRGVPTRVYFPKGVRELLAGNQQPLVITEGEKKALASTQAGFPCISIPGVDNWHPKKSSRLVPDLERINYTGRVVFIAFDTDAVTNPNVLENERLLAGALSARGATVKIVRLPAADNGAKVGLDDFLVARGSSELFKLMQAAEQPTAVEPDELRGPAIDADPAVEARRFLETGKADGVSRLRFWRGTFIVHRHGRFADLPTPEVRGEVVQHLNQAFSKVWTVTTNNVLDQLKAHCLLRGENDPPVWIEPRQNDWPAAEILCTKSQLVHLPSLVTGSDCLRPATPRFFSQSALEFQVDPLAPPPVAWIDFLHRLWSDDQESIDVLQEWCGYCLMPETWLQKILVLIGPKRSGKGTIARVLRELIGRRNVAGQTLAGMGTNFGLWPLLGKLLTVISDARLSGRTDTAIVVERLLSISGEDAITIDRKNLEPITTRLPTRFMILTNEVPRLGDSSGAMAGRMIVLRLTECFYGREDHQLTERLLIELPGIMLWAAEGWRRLHERGRIVQPQSALELVGDLEDLASPISAFVRERCICGPQYSAAVADLFEAWKSWCEENGRREAGTQQTFGRDLIAAIPQLRRSRPRDEAGTRYRVYQGIGVLSLSSGGF